MRVWVWIPNTPIKAGHRDESLWPENWRCMMKTDGSLGAYWPTSVTKWVSSMFNGRPYLSKYLGRSHKAIHLMSTSGIHTHTQRQVNLHTDTDRQKDRQMHTTPEREGGGRHRDRDRHSYAFLPCECSPFICLYPCLVQSLQRLCLHWVSLYLYSSWVLCSCAPSKHFGALSPFLNKSPRIVLSRMSGIFLYCTFPLTPFLER